MKIPPNNECPCGSFKKYKKCCKVFHIGQNPKTAEQLMRSRFTAFILNDADYIINTTHNKNQDYTLNTESWRKDIINFSKNTDFIKLEILENIEGKDQSFVKFKATITQDNLDASFTENSRFLKINNKWFYVDGTFI